VLSIIQKHGYVYERQFLEFQCKRKEGDDKGKPEDRVIYTRLAITFVSEFGENLDAIRVSSRETEFVELQISSNRKTFIDYLKTKKTLIDKSRVSFNRLLSDHHECIDISKVYSEFQKIIPQPFLAFERANLYKWVSGFYNHASKLISLPFPHH
jgi:hypothetical protein